MILSFITIIQVFHVQAYDFVVGKGDNDDFKTVQDAIDAVPDFRKNRTTIFIRRGIYKEKLVLSPSKRRVSLIGEDVQNTILTYDDYNKKENRFGETLGTTGSSSFFIFGEDFTAENITFENSSGPVGPAVAVRIESDKVAFKNCRFLGFQDTMYLKGRGGRQYYRNCYIEGTVDFIFGNSTAVFDQCTIFCKNKGYVSAPSTEQNTEFGFVFLNCNITGDAAEKSFYLGRPWRPYGKSVFIGCKLGNHIKLEGWNNWRDPAREKTAYFAEYNNTGEGAKPSQRVKWSLQLTSDQIQKYTVDHILGEWVNELAMFRKIN